jgi:hypothetical protein
MFSTSREFTICISFQSNLQRDPQSAHYGFDG